MTNPPPPADELEQLETYQRAVRALGGISNHARLLGIGQRHGGGLYSGARPIPLGILADTAAALLDHADLCRQLERQLSPAFVANLTERQRQPTRRGAARGERPL